MDYKPDVFSPEKKSRKIEKIQKPVMDDKLKKVIELDKNKSTKQGMVNRLLFNYPPVNSYFNKCSRRQFTYKALIQCKKSPFASRPPSDWDYIKENHPYIVRES